MTSTKRIPARLASGLRHIVLSVARLAAGVAGVLIVAAAISLPLWYLATHHRRVFNLSLLAVVVVSLASLIVRRVKRGRTE